MQYQETIISSEQSSKYVFHTVVMTTIYYTIVKFCAPVQNQEGG